MPNSDWGAKAVPHPDPKDERIAELERSNAELRAALIIAGKEIRKLNFGKKDSPVLAQLRKVLREARKTGQSQS